ncbi:hypothetical protein ACJJID_02130 [Microbulbifer sp. CnH-101-G]|uniref:hypothetical protein n=1 Tax=Microbulbifer sp. CnH-101-G TaxID=3243393 RepID=UPI004039B287
MLNAPANALYHRGNLAARKNSNWPIGRNHYAALLPSTQHPAPSTQHPAPSTQHPAPSVDNIDEEAEAAITWLEDNESTTFKVVIFCC